MLICDIICPTYEIWKGLFDMDSFEEKKLIELGVIKLEKESSISRFVKVCKSLAIFKKIRIWK